MVNSKKFLAIIPARGGSKRLQRKNILMLYGKPLISWTIEAALKSIYIDHVVVSSDDDEILEVANRYSVEILHRPSDLANDIAKTFDVVAHALAHSEQYDYVVLLQPTSPLRSGKDIDRAIVLLEKKEADAIVSVCEMEHSPLWSNTLPENDSMTHFLNKETVAKRSQDLPPYYRINGAIYICKTKKLLEEKTFFLKENIFAFKMDRESSIDIDEEIDFELAKIYIEKRYNV